MMASSLVRSVVADLQALGLWPAGFMIGLAAMLFAFVRLGHEPAWLLAGIVAAGFCLWAMRKWPMAIIAGLLFVGNFKTVPARGITITDPTFILLLLCVGAMTLELLFAISGASEWSLSRLFAGQGLKAGLFLLFIGVLAASLSYTASPDDGSMKLLRIVVFDVTLFFAPLLLLKSLKDLRQFAACMLFLGVALTIREVWEAMHPTQAVLQGDADITKIGDGLLLGTTVLMVLFSNVPRSRMMTYGALTVLAVGLIASAARGPMLGLLLTLVITELTRVATASKVDRSKLILGGLLVLLISMGAFVWLQKQPGARNKVEAKQAELLALLSGSQMTGGTVGLRFSYYRSSIQAFSEHPILGLGLAGWSSYYSVAGSPKFPHNFILEVAAEQGFVGLTVLTALLVVLLRSSRRLTQQPDLAFVFPVILYWIIVNSFTGELENRDLWFWFGMVAAACRLAADTNHFGLRGQSQAGVPRLVSSWKGA
jgi:O-antigen ligase